MSELSDLLDEILRKEMTKDSTLEASVTPTSEGLLLETKTPGVEELPGFTGSKEHNDREIAKILGRCFRKNAGSADFESPIEAYNRTVDRVVHGAVPLAWQSLADGVQMGQRQSFAFKKYNMFNKLDEAFDAEGWRSESALIALPFEADQDSQRWMVNYLEQTCLSLGTASGYANGMHHLRKIWDVWALSLSSVCIAMYVLGNQLGERWAEETVLNGIISASEEKGL